MSDSGISFCPHCGAVGTKRMGRCKVCGLAVCERCGNTQHAAGDKEIIHNECLKKSGDSFSMIKFVK